MTGVLFKYEGMIFDSNKISYIRKFKIHSIYICFGHKPEELVFESKIKRDNVFSLLTEEMYKEKNNRNVHVLK